MKKAIIKKGLESGKVYGPCKFFNEMKTDEPLEIVDEFEAKHVYKLSNGFIYSEEMIEKVVETDEGECIVLKVNKKIDPAEGEHLADVITSVMEKDEHLSYADRLLEILQTLSDEGNLSVPAMMTACQAVHILSTEDPMKMLWHLALGSIGD